MIVCMNVFMYNIKSTPGGRKTSQEKMVRDSPNGSKTDDLVQKSDIMTLENLILTNTKILLQVQLLGMKLTEMILEIAMGIRNNQAAWTQKKRQLNRKYSSGKWKCLS